jgi:hypothetical protein
VKAENLVMEGNKEVRACKEYKYLRITLNQEGTDDSEINNGITKARRIVACLNDILWSKNIIKKKKFNKYETMVKSVILYYCERCTCLTEKSKRALETTEINAI